MIHSPNKQVNSLTNLTEWRTEMTEWFTEPTWMTDRTDVNDWFTKWLIHS